MMLEELLSQLERFQKFPDILKKQGIAVDVLDAHCFSIQTPGIQKTSKKYDVFISALIHGNEVGGLGVINSFLEFVSQNPHALKTKILFHLGNIEAAKKNQRFLERDLNRSFLNDQNSKLEEKIARKIEDLVVQCSYNLDIHQTNSTSKTPFFIFAYTENSFCWAKYLDPDIPAITSTVERHKDGSTLDYFCRKNNIPSCTIELGQAGFSQKQMDYGANILKKILDLQIDTHLPVFQNMYKVIETLYWDQERIILKDGFENFSLVQKGEILGQKGGIPYAAPHAGALLFPKYGKIAENTKEVVTFATEISDPAELD